MFFMLTFVFKYHGMTRTILQLLTFMWKKKERFFHPKTHAKEFKA